ncbi:F-box protein, partial [Streptomyces sp. NPDC057910]|uniref:F-box protein n=1 Tax=Streptomyces sp. NPDC057910 TaxID=3346278 RepID=UPI0036E05FEA
MTTGPEDSAGLNAQAEEVWAIVAPALQDSDGPSGLPARAYQALQTWPAHNLPHDLWQEILGLLPLEDQTRLAHTSHQVQEIVEQLAPQVLDCTAHITPGFIRTLYTQTELDTSLNAGKWVEFIPGTGSNLTIGQGKAQVHGPGTLTAVTAGTVTAHGDTHITTVTGGTVDALEQATITTVTGGTVDALEQATITT